MNLQEAMDALNIETTVMVDYAPEREENFPGASHYLVTFTRETSRLAGTDYLATLQTQFSTGRAWTREPTGLEVMRGLLWDASSVRYESFEAWCSSFGYSDDSRQALATYKAVEEQTAELARFLYDDSSGEGSDERLLEWLDTESIADESLDDNPRITSISTGGK